ncbi:diguanylate cyclase [Cupriavidus plantarum]|uniref:diguanylate cyclase n=1 Tax=Cupriavidus plantarum TaxID=942865 RepID=UPI00339DA34B
MVWRKLLPQPRWLPRAAIMYPQRVVVVCFAIVMLLTVVIGVREVWKIHDRVVEQHQHSLALRALGVGTVFATERQRLAYLRDYAVAFYAGRVGQDFAQNDAQNDAQIEAAFAARNDDTWTLATGPDNAPVIGVGARRLAGLAGFARRDETLREDLRMARALSPLLGLLVRTDKLHLNVLFISRNGLFVVYPEKDRELAPSLVQRFDTMPYYRDLLPDRAGEVANDEPRWIANYTQFGDGQLISTLSIPIHVRGEFRGVIAVDVAQTRLQALLNAGNAPDETVYLMTRDGRLVSASQGAVASGQRWPADLPGDWRDIPPARLFEDRAGTVRQGAYTLLYQQSANGNWVLFEAVSPKRLFDAAIARMSPILVAVWLLLPLLLWVTLFVVTHVFDHYLALGEKLQELAEYDPLTGLANRRHFKLLFDQETERRLRHARPLALMMVDIDFFKRVNDKWGHASGDRVLAGMATLMREQLRTIDVPARLGGEEFAVLLPGATLREAVQAAERLRVAIAGLAVAPAPDAPAAARAEGDGRIHFTISIGVVEAGAEDGTTLDVLLANADRRLYAAKASGRNRTVSTDDAMATQA